MAAASSPERTVVLAQRASVSVFDARYLGLVFKAPTIGFSGSSLTPSSRRDPRVGGFHRR
jgi:hypothetical protein